MEYVLVKHGAQARSADVVPAAETYVPGVQVCQGAHESALAVTLKVPPAQLPQTRSTRGEPAALTNMPAPHTVHGMHALALLVSLNDPPGQAAHTRSLVTEPGVRTSEPAPHMVQAPHEAAFLAVLKVPVAQARQTLSADAVPADTTYCPTLQSLHATQALAGFLSWSQVPSAHAMGSLVAPAQYWPTSHAAHVAGVLALPGAV